MGLVGINPFRSDRQRKPSALEQIALGVDVASKILGTGAQVYTGIKGAGAEEDKIRLNKDALELERFKSFKEATPEEIQRGLGENVPGFKTKVVPREKPDTVMDILKLQMAQQGLKTGGIQEKIASKRLEAMSKPKLAPEAQAQVTELSKSASKKRAVANQIEAFLTKGKDPKVSPDVKIKLYEQTLKMINSPENSDAVGKEEVERLGSLLKFKSFNFFNPGSAFGRDVEAFEEQLKGNVDVLRMGAESLDQQINSLKKNAPRVEPTEFDGMTDEQLNDAIRKLMGE